MTRALVLVIVLLASLAGAFETRAQVVSVEPMRVDLVPNQSLPRLAIRWTLTAPPGAGAWSVSSTSARFVTPAGDVVDLGVPIATLNAGRPAGGGRTATAAESFFFPGTAVPRLYYERTFVFAPGGTAVARLELRTELPEYAIRADRPVVTLVASDDAEKTVDVEWFVSADPGISTQLTSQKGVFERAPGSTIDSRTDPLLIPVVAGRGSVSEKIRIKTRVFEAARREGLTSIGYRREFVSTEGVPATAELRIDLVSMAPFDVQARPAEVRLLRGLDDAVRFAWVIVSRDPVSASYTSSFGRLYTLDGQFVDNVGGALTTPPVAGSTSVGEALVISEETFTRLELLGESVVEFRRTWSASTGAVVNGSLRIQIDNLDEARLIPDLSRLALSFDDFARVRVLSRGERLRAVGVVTPQTPGLFVAAWQVADPTTTRTSVPQFRTLKLIRKYVNAGERETFTSPPLPTRTEGKYILRFRVRNTPPQFFPAEIPYFVSGARFRPGDDPRARALRPIRARSPRILALGDRVYWEPAADVTQYYVEFYADPRDGQEIAGPLPSRVAASLESRVLDDAPLAGLAVGSGRTETALSPLLRARLPAGRGYLWRVIGLDRDGRTVAASDLLRVRVQ